MLRVSRVPVAAPAADADEPRPVAQLERVLPWAALLVGVAVFLFEIGRCLRRRPGRTPDPAWLSPAP